MSQDVKSFKTIEEQICILENRGLIIDDKELAKAFLSNLNYYRLSAYTLTLRKDNHFYDNVHFSDMMQIYNFDMELRAALMYLLESIEVSMRTYIGYYHAKSFGSLGYYDETAFEEIYNIISCGCIDTYLKILHRRYSEIESDLRTNYEGEN